MREKISATTAKYALLSGNFNQFERSELIEIIWSSPRDALHIIMDGNITPGEREYLFASIYRFPIECINSFYMIENLNFYDKKKLVQAIIDDETANQIYLIELIRWVSDKLNEELIKLIIDCAIKNNFIELANCLYRHYNKSISKPDLKKLEPLALMYEMLN